MADHDNLNSLRANSPEPIRARNDDGITTRTEALPVPFGVSGVRPRRRGLFRYDRIKGNAEAVYSFDVGQADRLSDAEASEKLHEIHRMLGLANAVDAAKAEFDHAFFICYALNGASQLGPYERVQFRVSSSVSGVGQFDYGAIMSYLGVDSRRFFRTFADSVVDACRELYEKPDVHDDSQMEVRARMMKLAAARGIPRYPYLVADCCEAAVHISDVEMRSVLASKAAVIGSTVNAVDQLDKVVTIESADAYNSSIGKVNPVRRAQAGAPIYRD